MRLALAELIDKNTKECAFTFEWPGIDWPFFWRRRINSVTFKGSCTAWRYYPGGYRVSGRLAQELRALWEDADFKLGEKYVLADRSGKVIDA